MKGFGAFRQFSEISVLQRLCERVEQAPDIALFKRIVSGFSPFVKHGWDETVGTHADIGGPDDEVVSFDVGDVRLFVSGDAFVLIVPFGQE